MYLPSPALPSSAPVPSPPGANLSTSHTPASTPDPTATPSSSIPLVSGPDAPCRPTSHAAKISSSPGIFIHRSPLPVFTLKPATTSAHHVPAPGSSTHHVPASQTGRSKSQRWTDASDYSLSSGGSSLAPDSYKAAVLSCSRNTVPRSTSDARPPIDGSTAVCRRAEVSCQKPVVNLDSAAGGWQLVKSRRERRSEQVSRRRSLVDLRGRCFNCLSFSHRASSCWRPTRYFRCFKFGHHAALCSVQTVAVKKAAGQQRDQQGLRVPVWQRLSGMDGSGHQDLQRKGSVWRRITPSQSATGTESSTQPALMAASSGATAPELRSMRKRRRAKRRRGAVEQAPLISVNHLLFDRASWTVLSFLILLGTAANSLGAWSSNLFPCSQRSVQKRVELPFPISVITTMEKKPFIVSGICIGSKVQGFSGSVFAIHNHLILKAQPSTFRLKIPSPPSSSERQTLPHATKRCPL
jgi:hypothetical protein